MFLSLWPSGFHGIARRLNISDEGSEPVKRPLAAQRGGVALVAVGGETYGGGCFPYICRWPLLSDFSKNKVDSVSEYSK